MDASLEQLTQWADQNRFLVIWGATCASMYVTYLGAKAITALARQHVRKETCMPAFEQGLIRRRPTILNAHQLIKEVAQYGSEQSQREAKRLYSTSD